MSRRATTALATTALAIVTLALSACSQQPEPSPTPTQPAASPSPTKPAPSRAPIASPEPAPSVGPLEATKVTVANGADGGDADGHSLKIPQGWTAEVWANVPGARLATWAPDGALVVSNGDGGELYRLTPNGDGEAPDQDVLRGLDNPQGIGFALNGTLMILGERTRISAYEYADGSFTDPRVLVDNLPSDGHGSKGVAVHGQTIYYSLGSESNRSPSDRASDPERATVWSMGLAGENNEIVARGVRNGFALAIAPDGTLFTAVNQVDNQPYPFEDDTGWYGREIPEFINENPVDQVARLTQGIDLGWPYCVPDTRDTPDNLNIPFVNDPVNNPDGDELDCSSLPPTMVGLPAHSAPLGLSFTAGTPLEDVLGQGAIVTSHGSWNREPPRAPNVAFLPWDDATKTLGAAVPLVTGWQSDAGGRWGRAVTAVPGPDGSLYVTDDAAGLVYRLTPGAP